jgi:hypothetical protein
VPSKLREHRQFSHCLDQRDRSQAGKRLSERTHGFIAFSPTLELLLDRAEFHPVVSESKALRERSRRQVQIAVSRVATSILPCTEREFGDLNS